jgi:hypothetical protein
MSRRHIALLLDGLRSDAATALPVDQATAAAAAGHLMTPR